MHPIKNSMNLTMRIYFSLFIVVFISLLALLILISPSPGTAYAVGSGSGIHYEMKLITPFNFLPYSINLIFFAVSMITIYIGIHYNKVSVNNIIPELFWCVAGVGFTILFAPTVTLKFGKLFFGRPDIPETLILISILSLLTFSLKSKAISFFLLFFIFCIIPIQLLGFDSLWISEIHVDLYLKFMVFLPVIFFLVAYNKFFSFTKIPLLIFSVILALGLIFLKISMMKY